MLPDIVPLLLILTVKPEFLLIAAPFAPAPPDPPPGPPCACPPSPPLPPNAWFSLLPHCLVGQPALG